MSTNTKRPSRKGIPNPKRVSIKQKRFVKEYLKHGNGSKAILASYDTTNKNTSRRLANKNLNSPRVIAYMAKVLKDVGLTDKDLASDLKIAIKAGLTPEARSKAKVADALRGIELALRVKDRTTAERKRVESASVRYDLRLEGKTEKELLTVLDELNSEVKTFKRMMGNKKLRDKVEEASEVVKCVSDKLGHGVGVHIGHY